ncbi:unnamed protein product [Polarella glacialis]|uniref:TauD/TfdA-like domain-containing protein n=1 Tax=Polarella glacialis TaxID=89957 RepID=A0A813CZ32_POLGL|nr:unnamed protein product [Polarella glacialis]
MWSHGAIPRSILRGRSSRTQCSGSVSSRMGKALFAGIESGALEPQSRALLRRELWAHGVVVLRTGRVMTAALLEDFARTTFGEEIMQIRTTRDRSTPATLFSPGVAVFGNPQGPVALAAPFDPEMRVGTHLWHVDKQLLPKVGIPPGRPYVAMMHMVENAFAGHTTSFADMQAARANLEPLRRTWWAAQSMWHLDPFDPFSGSRDTTCRRELLPLVCCHPFTGVQSLQLGPSGERSILQGLETAAQELQEAAWRGLVDEAVAAQRSYDHVWEAGDLVIWDNSQMASARVSTVSRLASGVPLTAGSGGTPGAGVSVLRRAPLSRSSLPLPSARTLVPSESATTLRHSDGGSGGTGGGGGDAPSAWALATSRSTPALDMRLVYQRQLVRDTPTATPRLTTSARGR